MEAEVKNWVNSPQTQWNFHVHKNDCC